MRSLIGEIKKHHFIKLHEQKHLFQNDEIKRKREHIQPLVIHDDLPEFYRAREKNFIPKKRC